MSGITKVEPALWSGYGWRKLGDFMDSKALFNPKTFICASLLAFMLAAIAMSH